MVLPAAIMTAAPAATSIAGGAEIGGATGAAAGIGGGGLGSLGASVGVKALIALNNALNEKANAKAYQSYLNGIIGNMQGQLEGRAEKYDTKLQNQFNEAEPQYFQEAYSQLPELTQLVQDIANQSAEAQRQNRRQINANLAQQGVRGGQAAILSNRATGELNRDLQRDINQTVYNEAANRQNSRLNYFGDKALTPWKTMSNSYGNSMVGANNALSGAQAGIYANAYNRAMNNYGNTNRKHVFGLI